MTVEQQTGEARRPAPCAHCLLVPTLFPPPRRPRAAAGPATDFTNVGVQEMMKLYYCERRQQCCHARSPPPRPLAVRAPSCLLPHAPPALPLQPGCSRTRRCSSGWRTATVRCCCCRGGAGALAPRRTPAARIAMQRSALGARNRAHPAVQPCLTPRRSPRRWQAPQDGRRLLPAPRVLLHAGRRHLCALPVLQGVSRTRGATRSSLLNNAALCPGAGAHALRARRQLAPRCTVGLASRRRCCCNPPPPASPPPLAPARTAASWRRRSRTAAPPRSTLVRSTTLTPSAAQRTRVRPRW